jgi:hypothetical protein
MYIYKINQEFFKIQPLQQSSVDPSRSMMTTEPRTAAAKNSTRSNLHEKSGNRNFQIVQIQILSETHASGEADVFSNQRKVVIF